MNHMGNDMKLPQLRILATSFCGRKCIYCRPTGEGGTDCVSKEYVNTENALAICKLYKEKGGREVKITGGDPVFWPDLVDFVKCLKKEIGMKKVEVITRSPKIMEKISALTAAGLDVLNFSLDTIDRVTYEKITGSYDYNELISTIQRCAKVVPVKINMVILKNINDSHIKDMIAFCESIGVQQLKLLDVINDLQDTETGNSYRLAEFGEKRLDELYISLTSMCAELKKGALKENIVYQGGLGHPMNELQLASGLIITIKNSENGAWYGSICETCPSYPCHDALMAIRLTSDNRMQYCLLNENASVSLEQLTPDEIEHVFTDSLEVYQKAHLMEKEEEMR